MAARQITLEILGDADKATGAFREVGQAADKLAPEFDKVEGGARRFGKAIDKTAGDLDRAEGEARRFGKAMDATSDVADRSESKFIGLADVAGGLGEILGIDALGPISTYGIALADLTGGFAQLGPLIGSTVTKIGTMIGITGAQTAATASAATAQTGLNVAMLANPIGLIVVGIVGLIGVFVLLWTKVDGFKEAIIGVFDKIKNFVPALYVLGAAVDFVSGLFGKKSDAVERSTERDAAAFAELNTLLEAQRQKWQTWHDSVTALIDGIQNPLQRARDQSTVSFADINANLIDNEKFFRGWIANLQNLMERGFPALASKMFELGPTAEKAVGEMMTKTDPQLRALEGRFASAGVTTTAAFTGAFMSYESLKATGHAGTVVATSFRNGFLSGGAIRIPFVAGGLGTATPIPLMAAGGPVTAGHPYIVGDDGAELFIPNTAGRIVPGATGTMSGAGATVVHNHYYTNEISVTAIDPAAAQEAVVTAIREYERRNGPGWRT